MSSDSEKMVDKIEKYIRHLKEGTKIGHSLNRLEQIPMTFDLLTRTGVGKVVNRLAREDEDYAEQALRIVADWKRVASDHQKERSPSPIVLDRRIKKEVKEEPSDSPGESSASSSRTAVTTTTNNNERKRRVKEEDSGYGGYPDEEQRREKKKSKPAPPANAFLAALASGDGVKTQKPKKLKPFDLSMDIDLNYRPMPSINIKREVKEEEKAFDPAVMFKPRNGLTKIFAGRKKASTLTEVPRLFDCCIRVLQNHINDIDSFGDIPFHVVRPILETCTWKQLAEIERKNPYLEEDSDELWEKLIGKHHASKDTKKHETWKEMFMRCEAESSDRLKMLSERISKHGTAAHDKVRKVVAITEVKMNRGPRRGATVHMPAAIDLSKARKEIFDTGSKGTLNALPSTVQNRGPSIGPSGSRKREAAPVVKAGPRKGALMAKTMKMLGLKKSDRK